MKYNNNVLNIFFNGLLRDERAKHWLYENEFPELTAFINALYGLENAENWLINNNRFRYLGHFSKAIKRNSESLEWLIDHGFDEEAATVGMIHEKTSCEQWLLKDNKLQYIKIGEILQHKF